MQGLYFVAFVIAILVVVHWAWKNDKIGPTGKSTGILRMTAMEERKPAGVPPLTRGEGGRAGVAPSRPRENG
jgi:hypothetical protein